MKNIFKIIGLIGLFVFSFFLTKKTAIVIRNMDEIMISIKKNKDIYQIKSENAIIKNSGIIPGISSAQVNVDASYQNMSKYGKYNDDLYVYDYIRPNISIVNNKDKYIINGNIKKRMVSLIFIVNKKMDLVNIVNIFDRYYLKANFFSNDKFLNHNLELVYQLINEDYEFGITKSSDYKSLNTFLTKIGKQQNIYCYYNLKTIDKCKMIGAYSIKGTYINKNYYQIVTKKLKSGSLLVFKVDTDLINNLDTIIKYIIKKGYKIENLNTHLTE